MVEIYGARSNMAEQYSEFGGYTSGEFRRNSSVITSISGFLTTADGWEEGGGGGEETLKNALIESNKLLAAVHNVF